MVPARPVERYVQRPAHHAPGLAQLLLFCDGSRTPAQIHADFCDYINQPLNFAITEQALAQLDAACLFDNQRARQALRRRRIISAASRTAPRPWPT